MALSEETDIHSGHPSDGGLNLHLLQPYAIPIGIAVILILLTCLKLTRKKKLRGTYLLLIGESGAGKTSLLYQLATKKLQETTSSIVPIDTKFSIPSPKANHEIEISCIDIPGHSHFRNQIFAKIGDARAILIVVDSSNKDSIINTSEFLYRLLINPAYRKFSPPTTIVLNKQDLANARKINVVKEDMIVEIERLKVSKKAIEDEDHDVDWLRLQPNRFNFEEQSVNFIQASVKNNEVGAVLEFLQKIFG